MEEYKEKQMSESFIVAILLALAGGFLDAYTYVCRDQVFANAQTGNVVRVGMTLANGEYLKTVRYFIPIVAFCLGIMLTMFIRNCYMHKTHFHWRQIILFIEIMVMFIVSWIPVGQFNIIVNILISFICAMQAECFRKVLGKPFSSTMCTGNLGSGTEYFYQAILHRNKSEMKKCIHYCFIVSFFIFGAILGVWITNSIIEKAILICILPMIIALCMMFKNNS